MGVKKKDFTWLYAVMWKNKETFCVSSCIQRVSSSQQLLIKWFINWFIIRKCDQLCKSRNVSSLLVCSTQTCVKIPRRKHLSNDLKEATVTSHQDFNGYKGNSTQCEVRKIFHKQRQSILEPNVSPSVQQLKFDLNRVIQQEMSQAQQQINKRMVKKRDKKKRMKICKGPVKVQTSSWLKYCG